MKTFIILTLLTLFLHLFHLTENASSDTYILDTSRPNGIGRRFDGIGAISGGGATSKLLLNYPEQQRNEILDYLFLPKFGASLQIFKVEIGGDGQSSEGTEASHMHNEWDENYERGYEWWMMKEAKKRNPSIRLYGLPWSYPGWIGGGEYWPYHNRQLTATYIVKWILGAKKVHNLTIDYIGTWNEKPYDMQYIETLRKTLNENGLQAVKIVAADMIGDHSWDIAKDLLANASFNSSVDIVGAHYTDTLSTAEAQKCGKPLWSSEDYSGALDNEIGGGCLAKILNHNYINGFMTSTIGWNLVTAYYSHLPYPRRGLMTAQQPWSGHYEVDSPIWMAAHTAQFTSVGWHFLKHGTGVGKLVNGGTFVSYISPDSKDLTLVIETMDTMTHPLCMSARQTPVKPVPQNATFVLKGALVKIQELNVRYSKLGFGSQPSTYFKDLGKMKVQSGMFTISLGVNEVLTLSTISDSRKGTHPNPPPPKEFPLPYKDNFEAYPLYKEANNLAQQVGAFETHQSSDPHHGKVYRQMVLDAPVHWCPLLQKQPITLVGNYNWSDLTASVDVKMNSVNQTTGAFLALRVDQGGCTSFMAKGVFLYILPQESKFQIAANIGRVTQYAEGYLSVKYNTWYTLMLSVKGQHITVSVNKQVLFKNTVKMDQLNGFLGFGTDSFGVADFDNLLISES